MKRSYFNFFPGPSGTTAFTCQKGQTRSLMWPLQSRWTKSSRGLCPWTRWSTAAALPIPVSITPDSHKLPQELGTSTASDQIFLSPSLQHPNHPEWIQLEFWVTARDPTSHWHRTLHGKRNSSSVTQHLPAHRVRAEAEEEFHIPCTELWRGMTAAHCWQLPLPLQGTPRALNYCFASQTGSAGKPGHSPHLRACREYLPTHLLPSPSTPLTGALLVMVTPMGRLWLTL